MKRQDFHQEIHLFAGIVVPAALLQRAAKAAGLGVEERKRKASARTAENDRRLIRRSNRTAWLSLKVSPAFRDGVAAGADREGLLLVQYVEKAVEYYQSKGKMACASGAHQRRQACRCSTLRPRPHARHEVPNNHAE